MERLKVRLVMEERRRSDVYPAEVLAGIDRIADLARPFLTAQELADQPGALRDTEVLLTGWGAPVIDAACSTARSCGARSSSAASMTGAPHPVSSTSVSRSAPG